MPGQSIEVSDLTIAYDGKVALRSLNHEFAEGSSTAVMGANGSGKTTLLNAIAGLVTPVEGSVTHGDGDIGYVMQHGLSGWMPITAGEVIEMGPISARRPYASAWCGRSNCDCRRRRTP